MAEQPAQLVYSRTGYGHEVLARAVADLLPGVRVEIPARVEVGGPGRATEGQQPLLKPEPGLRLVRLPVGQDPVAADGYQETALDQWNGSHNQMPPCTRPCSAQRPYRIA